MVGTGIVGWGWLWNDLQAPLLHGISQELSHSDHMDMIGQVGEEALHMEV